VFLNLSCREEIERAFPVASSEGRREQTVVVEQFVPGVEHRLLVVGNQMVACAKGEHIYVTGDGLRTIAELIDLQINSDPRRGRSAAMPNKTVDLDATVLAQLDQEGVTPETVPADGRRVLVRQIGTHGLDVTASVHPEIAAIAVRAARAVGLDIAGVDLVARDIDRSPREQGAAVCEVNAGPQLMIHARPSQGPGQPVGEAIVDLLFTTSAPGRIPIAAILGSGPAANQGTPAPATLTARMLERILLAAGRAPGLTCGTGKWLAGWQCSAEPNVTADAARDLLVSPDIDAAVCELDWRSLASRGFPFDLCDVLVIDRLRVAEVSRADSAIGVSPLAVIEALVDTVATAGTIVLVDADTTTADLVARSGRTVIAVEPPGDPATVATAVATALAISPDAITRGLADSEAHTR
jgi:cyanophycin synthetase